MLKRKNLILVFSGIFCLSTFAFGGAEEIELSQRAQVKNHTLKKGASQGVNKFEPESFRGKNGFVTGTGPKSPGTENSAFTGNGPKKVPLKNPTKFEPESF